MSRALRAFLSRGASMLPSIRNTAGLQHVVSTPVLQQQFESLATSRLRSPLQQISGIAARGLRCSAVQQQKWEKDEWKDLPENKKLKYKTPFKLPKTSRERARASQRRGSFQKWAEPEDLPQVPLHGKISENGLLRLNEIKPAWGSAKPAQRTGRGGHRGKTCGKGHKGQKARGNNPRPGFQGGQTPPHKRFPKRGFKNMHKLKFRIVSLKRLGEFIDKGDIDPNELITMKTLRDVGVVNRRVRTGIVLTVGKEDFYFGHKIEIQVSRVTPKAREIIEANDGQVDSVYYNELGLRAVFTPEWFPKKFRLLPRTVRFIPVKHQRKFDLVGSIPPERIVRDFDAEEAAKTPVEDLPTIVIPKYRTKHN